jgi:pSer/pThr/pTyr-binding forkhead associated (FHA) protein
MIKLVLKLGTKEIKTIESDKDELAIGRNPGNDVQIDNLAVSDKHARIIRGQDGFVLQDLDSTNGTFVNEKKVTQVILKEKDAVNIGKHTLVVEALRAQTGRTQGKDRVAATEKTMKLDTKRHREMLKKQ